MDAEDFDTIVADEAAQYLRGLTDSDLRPDPRECLRCYLDRMAASHECDGTTRFARRWLETVGLPDREAILSWLESCGGYCDCEITANALPDHWPLVTPGRAAG